MHAWNKTKQVVMNGNLRADVVGESGRELKPCDLALSKDRKHLTKTFVITIIIPICFKA